MNLLKSAKNWLQYALNPLAQPTSIANSEFMLATPIGHTYCWPCAFCSCTQLAKCKQVKVVNIYMHLRLMQMCRAAHGVCALESSSYQWTLIMKIHTQQFQGYWYYHRYIYVSMISLIMLHSCSNRHAVLVNHSPAVRGEIALLDLELERESLLPTFSLDFILRTVFLGLCAAVGGGWEWAEASEGGGPLLPRLLLLSGTWLLLRAEDIQADSVCGKAGVKTNKYGDISQKDKKLYKF